jgi:tubulin polyglutamylase TTLL4
MGIDNNLLWSKIYDVIIKSILAIEPQVIAAMKKMSSKNNFFELYGFDVLIDNDLK